MVLGAGRWRRRRARAPTRGAGNEKGLLFGSKIQRVGTCEIRLNIEKRESRAPHEKAFCMRKHFGRYTTPSTPTRKPIIYYYYYYYTTRMYLVRGVHQCAPLINFLIN